MSVAKAEAAGNSTKYRNHPAANTEKHIRYCCLKSKTMSYDTRADIT